MLFRSPTHHYHAVETHHSSHGLASGFVSVHKHTGNLEHHEIPHHDNVNNSEKTPASHVKNNLSKEHHGAASKMASAINKSFQIESLNYQGKHVMSEQLIKTMLDNIIDDNQAEAQANFQDILSMKVTQALDQQKEMVAKQLGSNNG